MRVKGFNRYFNITLIGLLCLFKNTYGAAIEVTSIYVSREQSFNDQIEHLAVIDILLTDRNVAWILTTDGLYRFDTVHARKILTADQLNLDLDYNITELKLLVYANQVGVHNQKSIMLVNPVTLESDMVSVAPVLPHNCKPLETSRRISFLEYEGTKCNIIILNSDGNEQKFRVNQTTILAESELLLSTTSGLLYVHETGTELLDTSNSNFVDNFILSASKLTEEQFLIGTYKGLYFGYKNTGFVEKRAFGIPRAENITDLFIDTHAEEVFALTDQAIYRRTSDGSTKRIQSLNAEARVLVRNQNYLIASFINDGHCVIYLESPSNPCRPIENPEAISKITSLIYSKQLDSFIGTSLTGEIVRIYFSDDRRLKLESIKQTDSPLTTIAEYSPNQFLVGGIDSLSLFSISNSDDSISTQLYKATSTQGATVYDIILLDEQILVGTSKGILSGNLNQFEDFSSESIYLAPFFDGRSVPTINSTDTHLAFTTASTLWYAELDNPTDLKQLRIRNLFPDFEFEFGISGKTSDGKLVFGGAAGLLIWDGNTKISEAPPLLNFIGFSVNGEPLDLSITAEEITSVELSHEAYHFKADFAVMDYINPSQNRYEYKLEGFDTNWVDGKVNGSATYTNLPPGDYTLRVRGANSLGVWSDEEITLDITINPAWWRSWWAYAAYLCLLVWGVAAGKRHYDAVKLHVRAVVLSKEMVDASEDQMAIIERRNSTLTRSVENQTRLLKRFMHDIELIAPAYVGADFTQWLREMSDANERLILGHYITEVSCEAIGNLALEIVSQEARQRGLQCIGLTESPSPYVSSDLTLRIYALVVELARWLTIHLNERRISRIALTLSFFERGNELGIRASCSHSLRFGSDPMGNSRIRLLLQNLKAQIELASDHHAVEVIIDRQA